MSSAQACKHWAMGSVHTPYFVHFKMRWEADVSAYDRCSKARLIFGLVHQLKFSETGLKTNSVWRERLMSVPAVTFNQLPMILLFSLLMCWLDVVWKQVGVEQQVGQLRRGPGQEPGVSLAVVEARVALRVAVKVWQRSRRPGAGRELRLVVPVPKGQCEVGVAHQLGQNSLEEEGEPAGLGRHTVREACPAGAGNGIAYTI